VPEQSKSAKPRRPTCRAPDLDGSELCQWTQWNRPAPGPAWSRLSPPLLRLETLRRGLERDGGVAPALSVQVCASNSAILEVMGHRGLRFVPRTDRLLRRELAIAQRVAPTYPEIGGHSNLNPSRGRSV
jgi:hypothetical protein